MLVSGWQIISSRLDTQGFLLQAGGSIGQELSDLYWGFRFIFNHLEEVYKSSLQLRKNSSVNC